MRAWFKRRRRKRYLRESLVSQSAFAQAVAGTPACRGLDDEAQRRLRDLVTIFLHEKRFEAAAHAEVALQDRMLIAVNACLPILNLGIDAYDDWSTVIVYPDEFIVGYEEQDETGVVHSGRDLRTGEAWERGPLLISLTDVHAQADWQGYNVVIHECAHKLDMRNGASNGFPRLHPNMSASRWSELFTQAYEDLRTRIERGAYTPIDDYAAESPAECFAVFSEYFFEAAQILREAYPGVYQQLVQYYRQDPIERAMDSGSID